LIRGVEPARFATSFRVSSVITLADRRRRGTAMQGDCKTPRTRLQIHRHALPGVACGRKPARFLPHRPGEGSALCMPGASLLHVPPGILTPRHGVGREGDCDAAPRTAAATRQGQRRHGRQGRGRAFPRDDGYPCEPEATAATAQAATRTGHVTRIRCHHYLRGGAMRRIRVMLLLGSTGAAVLVGMFVHR